MKFVYVLISTDRNRYSAMARVSVASVRATHPLAFVCLLTDADTATRLRAQREPLFSEVDEVRAIKVPEGSVAWRSRYLKTRLGLLVEAPFVFLDVDTVVRGDLSRVFDRCFAVAGSRNLSRVSLNEQVCEKDLSVWRGMNWDIPTGNYLNSGVLFFGAGEESVCLSEAWHRLWSEQGSRLGAITDQQSLHEAFRITGIEPLFLPDHYNAQIITRIILNEDTVPEDPLRDRPLDWQAKVWHIYATIDWANHATAFEALVERVEKSGQLDRSDIVRLIRAPHPWRRDILLDDAFIRFARRAPRLDGALRLWLEGKRLDACRLLIHEKIRDNPVRRLLGRAKRRFLASGVSRD